VSAPMRSQWRRVRYGAGGNERAKRATRNRGHEPIAIERWRCGAAPVLLAWGREPAKYRRCDRPGRVRSPPPPMTTASCRRATICFGRPSGWVVSGSKTKAEANNGVTRQQCNVIITMMVCAMGRAAGHATSENECAIDQSHTALSRSLSLSLR